MDCSTQGSTIHGILQARILEWVAISFPNSSEDNNPPVTRETQVQSSDGEEPLGWKKATHCSVLAWKIPWTEEPDRLQSMQFQRIQFSSVTQSCLTLCNSMDCSSPGFHVHPQLRELTQTHVHWVNDAIQPSHPLSSPFLPAFNLSQHQGLFKWVSSSQKVAKVLEFQLQHLSFQWIFRTDFLWDGLVGSPCSTRDS